MTEDINYYILSIDSLNTVFDYVEGEKSIKYKFHNDSSEFTNLNENDLIFGFKKEPINRFQFLFQVDNVDRNNNCIFLIKIFDININNKNKSVDFERYYSTLLSKITFNEFMDIYNEFLESIRNHVDIISFEASPIEPNEKRNRIIFGAPGTGKSHKLNDDKDVLLNNYRNNYERVTFHPDYSYANFVGTYKPVPKENNGFDEKISYDYVPGPFMRVLVDALKNPTESFVLIIEEINRSNVAAVFGDVFQLLDRNKKGNSKYPINSTDDMKIYLKRKLSDVKKDEKMNKYLNELLGEDYDRIVIPSNMFIWATMNSADQGVFQMDTAFKRRWEFEYLSINAGEGKIDKTYVNFNNDNVSWNKLRTAINDCLSEEFKINEDKLLGPFFAFNDYLNEQIPIEVFNETFKNKIIMYLFEDVVRFRREDLFKGVLGNLKNITYSEICTQFDDLGFGIFCDKIKNADIFMDEE